MSIFVRIISDHTVQAYICAGILELIIVQLITLDCKLRKVQHLRIIFLWPYVVVLMLIAYSKHSDDTAKAIKFIAEHI